MKGTSHCFVSRRGISCLKQSVYFFNLPAMPRHQRLAARAPSSLKCNCFKDLPPMALELLLCVWIDVHVFEASVAYPGGTVRRTQRQQCGPLLAENTGPLLMFRPGPFRSELQLTLVTHTAPPPFRQHDNCLRQPQPISLRALVRENAGGNMSK